MLRATDTLITTASALEPWPTVMQSLLPSHNMHTMLRLNKGCGIFHMCVFYCIVIIIVMVSRGVT